MELLSSLHGVGTRTIELCETMQSPVGDRPIDGPLLDAWFELNYRLQEESADRNINKNFVEQWIMRLWTIVSPRPQCFWLFLARLNELALLCASRYVDCCECGAADELLAEPSRVIFHIEGGEPVVSRKRGWRAGPLLPCLYELLAGSGYMTEEYLIFVSRRTEKMAQVAGMLAGLGMGSTEDITTKLSCMDVDERREFRSRLCLFDRKAFNEIGRALHLFMLFGNVDDKYVGKYLCG
jgi:hypothetical protein